MHRFKTGSLLFDPKTNYRIRCPAYLVPKGDESGNLILLSIWLSGCGKFYFVVYDKESHEVRRERANVYSGSHSTLDGLIKERSPAELKKMYSPNLLFAHCTVFLHLYSLFID